MHLSLISSVNGRENVEEYTYAYQSSYTDIP